MSTAMSTKSFVSSREHAKPTGAGIGVAAFFGGLVLLILGVVLNQPWMAVVGFVPFASGMLYFNGMFWAKIIDSGKVMSMSRESIARRFYS